MVNTKSFSVSMDQSTRLITIVVSAITLYVLYNGIFQYLSSANVYTLIAPGILVAAFILAYLYMPKTYIISDREFIIERVIGDVRISLNEIKSVNIATRDRIGILTRAFGIGGYFGYWGRYHSTKIGWILMYATRRDNRILISLDKGRNYMISPDDLSLVNALMVQKQDL